MNETLVSQAAGTTRASAGGGRGEGGVESYRAEAERAEIGHEHLRVHVGQIPGEVLALQPRTEVHALGDVAKVSLSRTR